MSSNRSTLDRPLFVLWWLHVLSLKAIICTLMCCPWQYIVLSVPFFVLLYKVVSIILCGRPCGRSCTLMYFFVLWCTLWSCTFLMCLHLHYYIYYYFFGVFGCRRWVELFWVCWPRRWVCLGVVIGLNYFGCAGPEDGCADFWWVGGCADFGVWWVDCVPFLEMFFSLDLLAIQFVQRDWVNCLNRHSQGDLSPYFAGMNLLRAFLKHARFQCLVFNSLLSSTDCE